MRRFLTILSDVVIALLLVFVIAFAGVRLAGLTPYAVLSGSMEPELPVGSLIYVREVDPATIEVGDAVTFVNDSGQVVTHQAFEVDEATLEIGTQGINNRSTDGEILHDAEPVSFDRVLGVPVACVPYLGYVNAWVTSAPGILVIIALAIAIIALPWLFDLLRGGGRDARRADGRPAGRHMR